MHARVDPAALERFASGLDELRQEMIRKRFDHESEFHNLHQFWDDAVFKQYASKEEAMNDYMHRFLQDAEVFVSQLRTKAGLARQVGEYRF